MSRTCQFLLYNSRSDDRRLACQSLNVDSTAAAILRSQWDLRSNKEMYTIILREMQLEQTHFSFVFLAVVQQQRAIFIWGRVGSDRRSRSLSEGERCASDSPTEFASYANRLVHIHFIIPARSACPDDNIYDSELIIIARTIHTTALFIHKIK